LPWREKEFWMRMKLQGRIVDTIYKIRKNFG